MPGAVRVQIEYQSMEIMDSMDVFTPIYGTLWTYYHHMYGMEIFFHCFESVGWAFESPRGRFLFIIDKSPPANDRKPHTYHSQTLSHRASLIRRFSPYPSDKYSQPFALWKIGD